MLDFTKINYKLEPLLIYYDVKIYKFCALQTWKIFLSTERISKLFIFTEENSQGDESKLLNYFEPFCSCFICKWIF